MKKMDLKSKSITQKMRNKLKNYTKKEDILADSKSEYDDKYNEKKPMIIMKIKSSLNLMKMKILKNI